jgi:uncharacterized C2H2 Zn-finger protein
MGFIKSLVTGKPYEREAWMCPEEDKISRSKKAIEKHIGKKHGGKADGKKK